MRQDIAVEFGRLYGIACRAEDVTDCDGCAAEGGRLMTYCGMCGIRPCARAKKLENCAHCSEYVCTQLQEFFDHGGKLLHMNARERLDAVRAGLRHDGV